MIRLARRAWGRRQEDAGSMMLVFLILLVSTALTGVALATVLSVANSTRHNQKFTAALPPADAGINAALYAFNNMGSGVTNVPAPPSSCNPSATSPQWGAVQDATNPLIWHVTSLGCSNGLTRKVTADLIEQPRFSVGAFADSGAGTHGTSSGVTSYGGSGDLGIIGSNGSIVFTGNPTVNKIILYNFTAPNDSLNRCSGNPCSYSDSGNPGHTIVYTDPNPYVVSNADLPAGSPDPNQFITDQLNACQAQQGTLQPWVASQHGYTLANSDVPQCYSSMTFDGNTTVTNASSSNPLRIYVSGDVKMTMNGGACSKLVNMTCGQSSPDGGSLQIFTLGSSVSFVNQSSFVGTIWAPYATCAGDTSSASSDIYGSMVCKSIDNQGGWNFHYDERLQTQDGLGAWTVVHYAER
jgi:hypothetical protein